MGMYVAWNGAMPTTSMLPKVTTGVAIKTMLQIATPATLQIQVVRWGISFDASAAAVPIQCELIQTDVAATVTAHVTAGVIPFNRTVNLASGVTLGVAATGFTATAEGAITTTRLFDAQLVPPTGSYSYEWQDGREPDVAVSRFLRIRVLAAAAVNATCFVVWRE